MGRHCISILGLMARRSDMTKRKWSIKSFAKHFDCQAQKLLRAYPKRWGANSTWTTTTLQHPEARDELVNAKFTHCSPFFPFLCQDHLRTAEQCEIGWDRIGKRPEAKVLLYHSHLRNYFIHITHHKLWAFNTCISATIIDRTRDQAY